MTSVRMTTSANMHKAPLQAILCMLTSQPTLGVRFQSTDEADRPSHLLKITANQW